MTVPGPPSGDGGGIDVELEALRGDAAAWHGAAEELGRSRDQVQGMTVEPAAFSMWAVDAGLDRAYEELRVRMDRLLTQGGRAFEAIATSLGAAADVYGREDAEGAHRFDAGGGG